MMTVAEWHSWLAHAVVGDETCYLLSNGEEGGTEIKQVVWRAAENGLVFLFQKRDRDNRDFWRYNARRISPMAGKVLAAPSEENWP